MNFMKRVGSRSHSRPVLGGLITACCLSANPALAQQKTGPGISGDESLTWHGVTLYGVIDLGLQYDTHSAPFTPYRPAASGNIVRQNDYQSQFGVTPSNMGQSRVGLHGVEPLTPRWSAVFQVETFFNPQSGEIADSLKSLAANNGRAPTAQSIGIDGSSAGQAFQTAYVGLKSASFGTLTFGRQVTLLSEGTIQYDPNYNATAFGLLGASNTYSGGGSSEDNRLDSTVIYSLNFDNRAHLAALYKPSSSHGAANSALQANWGLQYAGLSLDGYYSKLMSAISAAPLTAAQVTELPGSGYSTANSLAGTVSDDTTYSLMSSYKMDALRVFAGFMYIQYTNPEHPLSAGVGDIGGYVLAFVTNNAYTHSKDVRVYWSGARYRIVPAFEVAVAYYGYHQSPYGTGKQAGCSTAAHNTCSGSLDAYSLDADYHFNQHFDVYLGAMYSGVHGGAASGYIYSTNINPTLGARYKF